MQDKRTVKIENIFYLIRGGIHNLKSIFSRRAMLRAKFKKVDLVLNMFQVHVRKKHFF